MNKPLLAYQIIAIAENLKLSTHRLVEPILQIEHCPEIFILQATQLLKYVDLLTEMTADQPDLLRLQNGFSKIRQKIDVFLKIADGELDH